FGRTDQSSYCDLAGVSAEVIASSNGASFREKMLITHRGISGPAILQVSSYWKAGQGVTIDLAPGREVARKVAQSKMRNRASLEKAFQGVLPKRFAERWMQKNPPDAFTNNGLQNFEDHLHHWDVLPARTEGYDKAEVTAGGVDTDELSSKTMESRKVPGLFFIGEVVDVTGHLGGFNFQWAWSSGAAA